MDSSATSSEKLPNGYTHEHLANAFSSERLELILLPTEKCNFRCTYCYEDFAIGRMSPDVVNGVKALITKRAPDLNVLQLSWFGGEPLLASNILFDISEHALKQCEEAGASFSGNLTTNGYKLDLPTLYRLCELGQRDFQITLDGAPNDHNRTRLRADGVGTFSKIYSNLIAARDTGLVFKIILRVHVTRENITSMSELIDMLNRDFEGDPRFSVHFHNVSDLGGPNSGSFDPLKYAEYDRLVDEMRGQVRVGVSRPTNESDLTEERYICYAARPNSLLIRADGRVGKCTVAFDDERNTIGRIAADGSMTIDNERLRLWMVGFEDFDVSTLACPLTALPELPAKKNRTIPIKVTTAA